MLTDTKFDIAMWKPTSETLGLRECHAPLCFNPGINALFAGFDFHLDQDPRYLYRTFDSRSSGYSDDRVVISPAASAKLPHHSTDIFSLSTEMALAIIKKHLDPWHDKESNVDDQGPNIDNLMSWTTSLLYAVQYAYYRQHRYGSRPEQIRICVVDVGQLPKAQFIRASTLLQGFYGRVKREDVRLEYNTRLLKYIYSFGEYLYQGVVVHERLSSVISLETLKKHDIATLYPELEDPTGHAKWALRTVQLQHHWHGEDGTGVSFCSSYDELRIAVGLATAWAKHLIDPLGLAIHFLSFKRRELKDPIVDLGQVSATWLAEWMRKPVDVKVAAITTELILSTKPSSWKRLINSKSKDHSHEDHAHEVGALRSHDIMSKLLSTFKAAQS